MALSTCPPSCPFLRDEDDQHEEAELLRLEMDERVRHLARPAREAASRLATAEATLEAVSRDVDARGALVSEIEALEGKIKEIAWPRRDVTGSGEEDRLAEAARRSSEALLAEIE